MHQLLIRFHIGGLHRDSEMAVSPFFLFLIAEGVVQERFCVEGFEVCLDLINGGLYPRLIVLRVCIVSNKRRLGIICLVACAKEELV